MKTVLVFQIKDTKSDSGQSYLGKQLADRRKREREQKLLNREKIITQKPKHEGLRSPDRGNSRKVQTQKHFFLLATM